jgi:hypothetical protein
MFFENLQLVFPVMRNGEQQDAHEFLFSLLNRFDRERRGSLTLPSMRYSASAISAASCSRRSRGFLTSRSRSEHNNRRLLPPQGSTAECACTKCCRTSSFMNRTLHVIIVAMMPFPRICVRIEKAVDFGFDLDLSAFVAKGD